MTDTAFGRTILAAILATVLINPAPTAAQQRARPVGRAGLARQMIDKCKAATVLVDLGEHGSGTAFCIHKDGFFLTNHHVVALIETGQEVRLVLHPSEKKERVVAARVVNVSDEDDLALLKVENAGPLSPLTVAKAADLSETMPVTTFGFPFGRLLASSENGYPGVSVNLGRISALRKAEGTLRAIQLDVNLNPGHSGGPVVDGEGNVIGIIFSGILDAGVGFAVPAARIRRFLQQPGLIVSPPRPRYAERMGPMQFEVEAVALDPQQLPDTIELIVRYGETERHQKAKAPAGKPLLVSATLQEPGEKETLRIVPKKGDRSHPFDAADTTIRIGARRLRLIEIRKIEARPTLHIVTMVDGTKYAGTIDGWDRIGLPDDAARRIPFGLNEADRIDIYLKEPPETEIQYELIARRKGRRLARTSGAIELAGVPAVWHDGLPSPEDPFAPSLDEFTVQARIDGESLLYVTPIGLYWEHRREKKPGTADERGSYVLVNGRKWYLHWRLTSPATSFEDETELFPLKLGPAVWDVQLLSVDGKAVKSNRTERGRITTEREDESLVVTFNDSARGAAVYRFRFAKKDFSSD